MGNGFEIKINNERPIRVGADLESYSVTCILTSSHPKNMPDEELRIDVGGYDGVADVHFDWLKAGLELGDTIQITVIKGDYHPPQSVRPRIPEEFIIAQKLKYFHALKEELKDYLQE